PVYRFHPWQANLRILEVTAIQTVPYVPFWPPFVERLIGTLRREYLDRVLSWTTADLQAKLWDFQRYYNITAIERKRGWRDAYQNQRLENLCHRLASIRTAGAGTVEACTKLQSPPDFVNSPWTGRF